MRPIIPKAGASTSDWIDRESNEPGPKPGEQVAEMLTDCDAEITIERLEDDIDSILLT